MRSVLYKEVRDNNWSVEKLLQLQTVLDEPVSQLIEQLDEINALTNIGERFRSANHARDIVYTLGQYGEKAEVAVSALTQTMKESGMEFVRIYAARALISIALEEHNELLLETLLQELRPRPSAILSVNSLGQMGYYAKPALDGSFAAMSSNIFLTWSI